MYEFLEVALIQTLYKLPKAFLMQTKILRVILDGIQKVTFVTCIIIMLSQFDALMIAYNYELKKSHYI